MGSPPAVMDVISGCAGSSENMARHTRPVSSGQLTVTESSARVTVIGPGRTPLRSNGTDTAAAGNGISVRIRPARKALRMANTNANEKEASRRKIDPVRPVSAQHLLEKRNGL